MKMKLGAAMMIGLLVLARTALAQDELLGSIERLSALFDWQDVALSVLVGAPFAGYLFRRYAEAKFRIWSEKEIDKSRSELRRNEELLKNTIESYSRSLLSVQDHILSGHSARMAALYSRKIEAAQNVWSGLYTLSKMRGATSWISLIKWDAIAEESERNPKVAELFDGLEGTSREEILRTLDAFYQNLHAERLYISQDAWTLCRAYASILSYYMLFLSMLRNRLPAQTLKALLSDDSHVRKLLSEALPSQSGFIKSCNREHLCMLLETIEINLLNELRHTLDGKQADDWFADKALRVMAQLQQPEDKEMLRKIDELDPALRSSSCQPGGAE